MDCSHSTICKFSSPENRQYDRVLSKLQELVEAINDKSERKFNPIQRALLL
jgi:trehalose-6-phosphate synthase